MCGFRKHCPSKNIRFYIKSVTFGTNHICKCTFSNMHRIKSREKIVLYMEHLSYPLRVSTSEIDIYFTSKIALKINHRYEINSKLYLYLNANYF